MQPKVKVVFFDFDDTLFPLRGKGLLILEEVLKEKGIAFNEKKFKQLPHYNMQDKIKITFPKECRRIWPEWNRRFSKIVVKESKPYPQTAQLLKFLKKNEVKAVVFSTKFRRHIKNILRKHRLIKYFARIIGRENAKKPKPDPFEINLFLRRQGIRKREAIYVGDSHLDEQSAKNAKIRFVFLHMEGRTKRGVKKWWKRIRSLEEFEQLVRQNC